MTDRIVDEGKVALVTGANKGIGRAIAEQLSQRGMSVVLGCRDTARGEEAAAELLAMGAKARAVELDVTDPATIKAAAAFVDETFGRLDVLVNNAGISGTEVGQAPSATDVDLVHEVFATNVFGVVAVTNTMLPLLRRSPAGRIVNMSSHVASQTLMTDPDHYMSKLPGSATYPPSKAAINSLTIQYAKELRGTNILVNAAAPGACATDFTKHLGLDIPRTATQGATIAVHLATLAPDGPTGGYFDDTGPVPW